MAFTDALRAADGATVVLNVDTSQTAKLEQAEREWAESVGTMSREALKLDLAQERLKKSLASYGAESSQAKRATIALRDAEDQAARSADRADREFRQQERTLGRLTRGAIAGSGAFRGFGRMIAFASASFLGGAGFIYAARQAISASSNLAEQQDFATRIFGRSTVIVEDYARNALGLARDQAFEAAAGIGALVSKFTDSNSEAAGLSVTLTKLAVDLASIKNTGVEEALTAIRSGLVGENEPLRRYAVLLNAATVEQEALRMTGKETAKQLTEGEKVLARVNIILREAAYAQNNYADTINSTANQEREAQKNLRNTAILIGDVLQPAWRELLRRVNDYLGDAENQRRLQEKVNEVMEVAETVVRGFASAFGVLNDAVIGPLKNLGLLDDAVRALLAIMVAKKVLEFAYAIGLIATNARNARTQLQLLSAVNFIPGGAAIPTGRGTPVPVPRLGPAGIAIAIGAALFGPDLIDAIRSGRSLSQQDFGKLIEAARQGKLSRADLDALRPILTTEQERTLGSIIVPRGGPTAADTRTENIRQRRAEERRRRRGDERRGRGLTFAGVLSRLEALSEAELDAEATPGIADDVRVWRQELALIERALRELDLTREQRLQLKRQRISILSELERIETQEQQEAARVREEAERKREEAREREEERMRRIREAAAKRAEERRKLFAQAETGRHGFGRSGLRRAALAGVDETLEGLRKKQADEQQMTLADLRRSQFEFLTGLQGALNQFGGNLWAAPAVGGQTDTNTWTLVQLAREQNRQLVTLTRGVSHPGAKYARSELATQLGGVGSL